MRRGRGFGRRGPSLLGTAARTAVIAGTATSVSGRVAGAQQAAAERTRRDQADAEQWRATQQQDAVDARVADALQRHAPTVAPSPVPAVGAGPTPDQTELLIQQLSRLGELRSAGILTEQEFDEQKARLLRS